VPFEFFSALYKNSWAYVCADVVFENQFYNAVVGIVNIYFNGSSTIK
jgi:hypothetical protein